MLHYKQHTIPSLAKEAQHTGLPLQDLYRAKPKGTYARYKPTCEQSMDLRGDPYHVANRRRQHSTAFACSTVVSPFTRSFTRKDLPLC